MDELEKILKMDIQHLCNKAFCRFYVKWKDYSKEEASWKKEMDSKRNYSKFVIKDNDF